MTSQILTMTSPQVPDRDLMLPSLMGSAMTDQSSPNTVEIFSTTLDNPVAPVEVGATAVVVMIATVVVMVTTVVVMVTALSDHSNVTLM